MGVKQIKLNAIITGGGRGIGRASAICLAETSNYETIIINYVQDKAAAEATCQTLEKLAVKGVPVRANMAQPEAVDVLFEEAAKHISGLDTLVHCAALTSFKPIMKVRANQWDLTMNVNGRSFLLCAQSAAPLMARGGSIIALSSAGGGRVILNYGALGPTKAALESLVRYIAVELAPKNIRVNGVVGGLVQTDSLDRFPWAKQVRQEVAQRTPSGRLGTADDLGKVVRFLASPEASWICGQLIIVDGGYSLLA